MSRPLVIVGVGEIMLAETPDGARVCGLAARVAQAAARLGHEGVPVSRLGQDDRAETVLAALRDAEVGTEHVQSDPDLATGRIATGPFAASRASSVSLAHDNLQWDYDLTDLAQRTDIVIYGLLASRMGETRSVIQQFLAECGDTLRVVDATNRPEGALDRSAVGPLIGAADVAVVDGAAIAALLPGTAPAAGPDAIGRLARQHDLSLVVELRGEPERRSLHVHGDETGAVAAPGELEAAAIPLALVSLLADLRRGTAIGPSLDRAVAAAGGDGGAAP